MDSAWKREEFSCPSTDGQTVLQGTLYRPMGKVRGLLQIVHGMTDYVGRYEPFMRQAAKCGYLAFGTDQLGHGRTGEMADSLGFIARRGGDRLLVEDVHATADYIRQKEGPELPLFVFGHSMGSFVARLYAVQYGNELSGAIFCGTGYKVAFSGVGLCLARCIRALRRDRAVSPALEKMMFGSYNKGTPGRTEYDWLTRDDAVVDAYVRDPWCTFHFTVPAICDLVTLSRNCNKKNWFDAMPKSLPTLLVSGTADPVGDFSKGVSRVYDELCARRMRDVTLRLFEGDRHEILNELDRGEVITYLLGWLQERTPGQEKQETEMGKG